MKKFWKNVLIKLTVEHVAEMLEKSPMENVGRPSTVTIIKSMFNSIQFNIKLSKLEKERKWNIGISWIIHDLRSKKRCSEEDTMIMPWYGRRWMAADYEMVSCHP